MSQIIIKIGSDNHEFATFSEAIDWLLQQPKSECTVIMDMIIFDCDTKIAVGYLRSMEKEADSFSKLSKTKSKTKIQKKVVLPVIERTEGVSRAQQVQMIIDETTQFLAAYTKKAEEMKAILEGDDANREQLPQTQKGQIDLRYSFNDGSKVLVTFKLSGRNIAGVVGSKVEE